MPIQCSGTATGRLLVCLFPNFRLCSSGSLHSSKRLRKNTL
jgi:hypothetical protein